MNDAALVLFGFFIGLVIGNSYNSYMQNKKSIIQKIMKNVTVENKHKAYVPKPKESGWY